MKARVMNIQSRGIESVARRSQGIRVMHRTNGLVFRLPILARLCSCYRPFDRDAVSSRTDLVPFQWRECLMYPICLDNEHLQPITNLDMPLRRTRERILDQRHHVIL